MYMKVFNVHCLQTRSFITFRYLVVVHLSFRPCIFYSDSNTYNSGFRCFTFKRKHEMDWENQADI